MLIEKSGVVELSMQRPGSAKFSNLPAKHVSPYLTTPSLFFARSS
jgi:hypothetical protein